MDPVYIVSLPHRTDRRNKMVQRMAGHGITEYTFVDAVGPDDPEVIELGMGSDRNSTQLDPVLKCTIGREHACFVSHLRAIKQVYESGRDGIILEDDTLLRQGFCSTLVEMKPQFKECPLVMLYSEVIMNYKYPSNNDGIFRLYPIDYNWGAVGFWISKEYAKIAYDRFHIQFCQIPFPRRTSECITILSGGKFILPQLCLEDPINISNLRDTRYNSHSGAGYHLRFDTMVPLKEYITPEPVEYKKLFSAYYSWIKHRLNGDPITVLFDQLIDIDDSKFPDHEQKYFFLCMFQTVYSKMDDLYPDNGYRIPMREIERKMKMLMESRKDLFWFA